MYLVYIRPDGTPSGRFKRREDAEAFRAKLLVNILSDKNNKTINPEKNIIILNTRAGERLPDDWCNKLLDYEDYSEVYNEE